MVLCEFVLDVAEKEGLRRLQNELEYQMIEITQMKRRLAEKLDDLICKIADEIIETAEEIEEP